MRGLVLVLVTVVLLGILTTSAALANAGPHGGYDLQTAKCASCHRGHTATGPELLKRETIDALCVTCHSGSGASTDVVTGQYVPDGKRLNGGGFSAIGGIATTSAHNVEGVTGTGAGMAWGGGIDGPGISGVLMCTSCHNPHGSNNYRILREPGDKQWSTAGDWPSLGGQVTEGSQNYTTPGGFNVSEVSGWCSTCHTQYTVRNSVYDAGDGQGRIMRYRHKIGASPNCITCHFAHGTTSQVDSYSRVAPVFSSTLLKLDNRGVCATCHVRDGVFVGASCNSCHGGPPATPVHQRHFASNAVPAGYGDVGNLSPNNSTNYAFGCGECHPVDPSHHQNGVNNAGGGSAEIELYNANAPGSLKQRSASNATYTPGSLVLTDPQGLKYTNGTCSNVYCHSANQVTSGPVGSPLMNGTQPILDARGNLTYDPYTVNTTRIYKTVSVNDASQGCVACHGNSPRTSVPDVQAGVGQSHGWIDDYGYEDLHNWNMADDPVQCRTCHYGTVTGTATWSRNSMDVTTFGNAPIANARNHVNGRVDVQFDTVDPMVYRGGRFVLSLASAVFNATDRSCSNVACHIQQNYVKWGSPYRWWNSTECDLCHRYSLPAPPTLGPLRLGAAPAGLSAPTAHPTVAPQEQCISCHTQQAHRR